MLIPPDIQDEKIGACLLAEYGLAVAHLTFLPLGADVNTAVYRATATNGTAYFCKLRRGNWNEAAVALPKWLSDQDIEQIIAPLTTQTNQLWAPLDQFKVILYPFVEGSDGYEIDLTDGQWRELGTALKRIHTAAAPPALTRLIRVETYAPQGRESVTAHLQRAQHGVDGDPLVKEVTAFLRDRHVEILDVVERAERLALTLQARPPRLTVCHSDIHAGNILINRSGAFYIVDWDEPILAPKERDLMSIGGGLMGGGRTPKEEEALFYQGYGQTVLDARALAYYRYERIIQDIAADCDLIFDTNAARENREKWLYYLQSNFLPNNTVEIAYNSDRTRDM